PATAPVWPAAPDTPRIRYLGEVVGESSLGRKRTAGEALREILAGPQPASDFSTPTAVAVAGDQLYVSDGQRHVVHMLNLATRAYGVIAAADGQPLGWPVDLALAEQTLFVADSQRAQVFAYGLDGTYQRTIGAGQLERPASVAVNPETGALWVLDAKQNRVAVFDRDGQLVQEIGGRGSDPGQFNFPAGLAVRPPFGAAVADAMNFRVQVFDGAGVLLAAFGQKGDGAGDFALPRDVAFDRDGHLYVLDNQFENVQLFEIDGRLLMAFGQEGTGPGEFYLPSGITIDDRDRIWVADSYNRRVQVFQYLREGRT
ncbi:MAG: 6-bladed beta-propeller, partial [Pirellulaceae bacterium]|nr:6-bladed beta-propeller [Pirellulaceae bacterium]